MGFDTEVFEHPVHLVLNDFGRIAAARLEIFPQIQGNLQSQLVGFLFQKEAELWVVDVLLAGRILRQGLIGLWIEQVQRRIVSRSMIDDRGVLEQVGQFRTVQVFLIFHAIERDKRLMDPARVEQLADRAGIVGRLPADADGAGNASGLAGDGIVAGRIG